MNRQDLIVLIIGSLAGVYLICVNAWIRHTGEIEDFFNKYKPEIIKRIPKKRDK